MCKSCDKVLSFINKIIPIFSQVENSPVVGELWVSLNHILSTIHPFLNMMNSEEET